MRDHTLLAPTESCAAAVFASRAALTRSVAALTRSVVHPLALLLLAFLANTLLWALVVEPGKAPDEWAHFDYVRSIAIHGALPIYGQTTHIDNPHALNSEAIQPPLYYLLATPVQLALSGRSLTLQVLGLRAFSALLSTITVALVYLLGRALAPSRPEFALTCAALVGFNPMFSFISAAINNDNLINLVYAALLLMLYHGMRQPQPSRRWLLGLGALLGVGLITKPSILAGGVASGLFLIGLAWQRRGRRLRTLVAYTGWVSGAALLVSGWMFLRNWLLYNDPTGVLLIGSIPNAYATHPYSKIGSLWAMLVSERPRYIAFFPSLLHGFWGVFDFYVIWLPQRIYATLDWLLIGGVVGTLLALWRIWRTRAVGWQRLFALAAISALIGALVLWLLISASYRIDYQPQGRYLFPILVPLTIAIVVGWERWAGLLHVRRLVAPLLVTLLLAINMLALGTAVAPFYHDRYLMALTQQPVQAAQPVYGAFAARGSFVAQQPVIDHLEVLIAIPRAANATLVWQLQAAGAAHSLASAIDHKPSAGLARYSIGLAEQRFMVGQSYTLMVYAPFSTEDKQLIAYMPASGGANNPDLGLNIVYPLGLNRATLLRADHELRADTYDSIRSRALRLCYPLALALMIVLATLVSTPALGRRWRLPGTLLLLGLIALALTASPTFTSDGIPTRALAASADLPLNLDAGPNIDLILLAGSTAAQKQPLDDPIQRVSFIQPYRFTINGDTRAVLAMQPPSAITYTLKLPAHAVLQTAIALNPQVWQPDKGDGVEFVVQLDAADGRHELLRRYIDPKRQPADRRWHAIALDLGAYAGQEVRLTLLTLPGPAGDGRNDWAGWGAPLVIQKEQRTENREQRTK